MCEFVTDTMAKEGKFLPPPSIRNDFARCEDYLNGRLTVGLYPTSIELLNKYQLLINDLPEQTPTNRLRSTIARSPSPKQRKKDIAKMHDVITPKNLLEIKFTLDIIRQYLTEQRLKTTIEIKEDYYAYIQYNLILVLAYTVIIMVLVLLDWKFVYRTVKN